MFQAARAVIFVTRPGDDKNEHSELPKHLPKDFPSRSAWSNELKNARLLRNDADYDPYPLEAEYWLTAAAELHTTAGAFLLEARRYVLHEESPP